MTAALLPLPFRDQYECRDETLEVYASDRRGIVEYRFNNLGYRNDIDYSTTETSAGVYIGSSITSAIGIAWEKSFARLSADSLGSKSYQFGQGCQAIDNQEILRLLREILKSDLKPRYVVLQFIDLDRRYDLETGKTIWLRTRDQKNIDLFNETFSAAEQYLIDLPWCFIGTDGMDHDVGQHIRRHPRCVAWNFPFIDLAGVGEHPGERWHRAISLGISKKLQQLF